MFNTAQIFIFSKLQVFASQHRASGAFRSCSHMVIATHNGGFHADDVFAVATLLKIYPDATIVRTRDSEQLDAADIVVDVGDVYDPTRSRFDHHQKGGAGARENGIPYASFGLIWKQFGEQIAGSAEVAESVDRLLVQPIDAHDVGVSIFAQTRDDVSPLMLNVVFHLLHPTWQEDTRSTDHSFSRSVALAQELVERSIAHARAVVDASRLFAEAYAKSTDKRVIELDRKYPWRDVVSEYPELLYIIHPDPERAGVYRIYCVSEPGDSFMLKKPFPRAWWGLRENALQDLTGVSGVQFCHGTGFTVATNSREAALQLVQLALDD